MSGNAVAFLTWDDPSLLEVHRRSIAGGWYQELSLAPADLSMTGFGDVSLDGDTLAVVGSSLAVLVREGGTWVVQQADIDGGFVASGRFDLDGNTLVQGPYVYERFGETWSRVEDLSESRCRISGDVIVCQRHGSPVDFGIYRRGLDARWPLDQTLETGIVDPNLAHADWGFSDGSLLIFSASGAFSFQDDGTEFAAGGFLQPPVPGRDQYTMAGVSCGHAVVHATSDGDLCEEGVPTSGVHVLRRSSSGWSWHEELESEDDLEFWTGAFLWLDASAGLKVMVRRRQHHSCCEQYCDETCEEEECEPCDDDCRDDLLACDAECAECLETCGGPGQPHCSTCNAVCTCTADYLECLDSCEVDCDACKEECYDDCTVHPDDTPPGYVWTFYDCGGAAGCSSCDRPENDCVNAPVVVPPITISRSMECATPWGGTCATITECHVPAAAPSHADVWYRVIGDGSRMIATTCGFSGVSLFDSAITVFEGSCGGPCVALETNEDPPWEDCHPLDNGLGATVSWNSEDGVEYFVRLQHLAGHPDETGLQFKLKLLSRWDPPPNDDCGSAQDIFVPGSATTEMFAASDPSTPDCSLIDGPGRDAWFRVVGTGRTMIASTCTEYGGWMAGGPLFTEPLEILLYEDDCETSCVKIGTNECANPRATTLVWNSIKDRIYLLQVRNSACMLTEPRFELVVVDQDDSVSRRACITPDDACGCIGVDTGCCNGAEPIGDLPDPARSLVIGDTRIVPHQGALVRDETDLVLPGRDEVTQLSIKRRHVSRQRLEKSAFGTAWDHSFNHTFRQLPGGEVRMAGYARADIFREIEPAGAEVAAWEGVHGRTARLSWNGSGPYVLRTCGGTEMHFEVGDGPYGHTAGTLVTIRSPNGNEIQIHREDGPILERRISSVTDSYGNETSFFYRTDRPWLVDYIRDYSGRIVSYGYDSQERLTSVTYPSVTGPTCAGANRTVTYTYFEDIASPLNTALASVTYPEDSSARLQWTYETNATTGHYGYLRYFQLGDAVGVDPAEGTVGGTYSYGYELLVPVPGFQWGTDPWVLCDPFDPNASCMKVTVGDPKGTVTELIVNAHGSVLRETVAGTYVTQFTYSPSGDLATVTNPMGNRREKTHVDPAAFPRLSHAVITQVESIPDPVRGGEPITYKVVREPVFNKPYIKYDPRAFEGDNVASEYATIYVYDYMENLNAAASHFDSRLGMSSTGLLALFDQLGITNRGDVNGVADAMAGNLVQIIHPSVTLPDGETVQEATEIFRYDQYGQLIHHQNAEGEVRTLHYANDGDGFLQMVVEDAGGVNTTTGYEYGPQDTFPANDRGVPTAVIDPRGSKTIHRVNELDQVVVTVRAQTGGEAGEAFAYEEYSYYDANNRLCERRVENADNLTSPDGPPIVTTYAYNLLDWLEEEIQDPGAGNLAITTRYEHDATGNVKTTTRAAGSPDESVEHLLHDGRGLLIQHDRVFEDGLATVTYGHDENGNVTTVTDDDGDVSTTTWDGHDRKVAEVDRVGTETVLALDAASNVLSKQVWGPVIPGAAAEMLAHEETTFDERGRAWRDTIHHWQYDSRQVGGPSFPGVALTTTRHLDREGRVTSVIDAEGDQSHTEYDGLGRVERTTDPEGNVVEYQYDGNGNLRFQTDRELGPAGEEVFVTEHEYDALNRLRLTIEPNGQQTSFEYDSRGNLRRTTDARGNEVDSVYDTLSRLVETKTYLSETGGGASEYANDGVITYAQEWDAQSRLTVQRDDKGQETVTTYDDLGRVTRIDFEDGTRELRGYDDDGFLTSRKRQNGAEEDWLNDGEGRPLQVDIALQPNQVGTTQKRWERDGLGRVIVATDDNGQRPVHCESWHDSLGRQIRETQQIDDGPISSVDSYWEGASHRVSDVYPNGRVVAREYDGLDRISEIREGATGALIASYDYVGPERESGIVFGNGTSLSKLNVEGTSTSSGTNPGYDDNRRHLRHEWKRGPLSIARYRNEYDGTGGLGANRRVVEVRDHFGHRDEYTLDSKYRITRFDQDRGPAGVTSSSAELDGTDKMTIFLDEGVNRLPVVDGDPGEEGVNQYSSFDGLARLYDGNGSLSKDGDFEYRHDYSGRLVEVRDCATGAIIAHHLYDDRNRRVRKVRSDGSHERYLYLDWQVLEERDTFDFPVRQYVDGRSIDDHVQMRWIPLQADFYYHGNSQAFPGLLTNTFGMPLEYYEYSWLGRPTVYDPSQNVIGGSMVGNPYLFQGRRYEAETGLYYFRNRYYSPEIGEFLTIDPEGNWNHGQGNGYSAFGGDAWNGTDPLGLRTLAPPTPAPRPATPTPTWRPPRQRRPAHIPTKPRGKRTGKRDKLPRGFKQPEVHRIPHVHTLSDLWRLGREMHAREAERQLEALRAWASTPPEPPSAGAALPRLGWLNKGPALMDANGEWQRIPYYVYEMLLRDRTAGPGVEHIERPPGRIRFYTGRGMKENVIPAANADPNGIYFHVEESWTEDETWAQQRIWIEWNLDQGHEHVDLGDPGGLGHSDWVEDEQHHIADWHRRKEQRERQP